MRPLRSIARVVFRSGFMLALASLALLGCGGDGVAPGQRGSLPTPSAAGGVAPGATGTGVTGVPGQTANAASGAAGANGFLITPSMATAGSGDGCRNPTIAFVIDGSGSMCEPFGTSTRWTELRNALLTKDTGLMYRLNGLASLGLYIYDGGIDFGLALNSPTMGPMATCMGGGGMRRGASGCPQIVEVKPAPANAAAIDTMYPMVELGGSTPTDKAMNYTVDQLLKLRGTRGSTDPQFILLATDGQPNDICMGGMGGDGTAQQRNVIAAADRAAAMGITTFVVSLASDPALQMHLDEVARHGDPRDPAAHSYTPTNTADLVNTLTKLLGTAVGCLF